MRKGREGSLPALFLFLAVMLAGCGHICGMPGPGTRQVRTELYFGMSIPGGGAVTEAQWAEFLEREVTPRFPAGLTVLDARGQWRDAKGDIGKEPTRVLVILHGDGVDAKLEEIRKLWREKFHQESVLRADSPVEVSY